MDAKDEQALAVLDRAAEMADEESARFGQSDYSAGDKLRAARANLASVVDERDELRSICLAFSGPIYWELIGKEKRPVATANPDFIYTSTKTGYFKPLEYETFYMWEAKLRKVTKSETPPAALTPKESNDGQG